MERARGTFVRSLRLPFSADASQVQASFKDGILSISIGSDGSTPDRIAAQIVTGIGFLGGGAILRSGMSVHGMTTAATIWVNAAIGMAAGAGEFATATAATGLTVVVLAVLPPIESYFERRRGERSKE